MLKKTMTYTDYNGVQRTEDFYFNLTKAEVAEMELEVAGGLSEQLKTIVATLDKPALIAVFKKIILKAYGVKSADGRMFKKSAQLSEEFAQTEAYSDLFMELAGNSDAAAAFINAIIPPEARNSGSAALGSLKN